MKKIIFSILLILSIVSVASSDAGTSFELQKYKVTSSIISNNIVNSSLYSGGYESCIADCEADYDYYCSGSNDQSWECEYAEDDLYACYDHCDSN